MIPIDQKNAGEVAQKVKAGELPGPAKTLAEAMHRVMEQVGYIQKKGVMPVGKGYKFAGEAQFIEALRPELVAQQIVISPVDMAPLVMEVFAGSHGPQNRVVLRVTFRFTHAPSGQTLDVVTCGEGIDQGDKATNKAMTGAMKYALRQAFVIETGNDPDETPSHTQERAPAQQSAPKDNMQLRAQFTQRYAQAKSRDDVITIGSEVGRASKAGQLSEGDCAFLRSAAGDALARFPAPQPAKA